MEKLLIIGTGDYAQMAYYFLSKQYDIVGFSEESAFRTLKSFNDLPIFDFEKIESLFDASDIKVLVAIGPNYINTIRERLYKEVKQKGFNCITYIHPMAFVWDENSIGENSFIFPNSVVEPYAIVGNNCVMWSGSILSHHSKLEDHCFMAPGSSVSGRSIIKANCFLGINSTIRDNVIIESKCIIGAGAFIKKNTIKEGVYSSKGTDLYTINSIKTKV